MKAVVDDGQTTCLQSFQDAIEHRSETLLRQKNSSGKAVRGEGAEQRGSLNKAWCSGTEAVRWSKSIWTARRAIMQKAHCRSEMRVNMVGGGEE